jgi:hypothetical protein
MRYRHLPAAGVLLSLLVVLPGCEIVQGYLGDRDGDAIRAPLVEMPDSQARLVKYPSVQQLGSWACQETLGDLPCGLIPYYQTPIEAQLQFQFSVTFQISNPNRVPVPTTELLVALHLWPQLQLPNSHLAGICTTLCEPGTEGCPIPLGEACVDRFDDVQDLATFLAAAIKGAIRLIMEAVNGQPVGGQWEAWTIQPSETVDLTFTFSIGIKPMLELIYAMISSDVLIDILKDGTGTIEIPYAFAGKLWFQVPYLGRIAIGLGPFGMPPDAPLVWRIGGD